MHVPRERRPYRTTRPQRPGRCASRSAWWTPLGATTRGRRERRRRRGTVLHTTKGAKALMQGEEQQLYSESLRNTSPSGEHAPSGRDAVGDRASGSVWQRLNIPLVRKRVAGDGDRRVCSRRPATGRAALNIPWRVGMGQTRNSNPPRRTCSSDRRPHIRPCFVLAPVSPLTLFNRVAGAPDTPRRAVCVQASHHPSVSSGDNVFF